MIKQTIIVPKGIRYISDWSGYSLNNFPFPHILNKSITGCGYTEYCIRNEQNVIILSPRKLLLQNKQDQHMGDVYYVKNEFEKTVNYEKNLNVDSKEMPELDDDEESYIRLETESDRKARLQRKEERLKEIAAGILRLKAGIREYWESCQGLGPLRPGKPCKILVTYDSFKHVKEALGSDIDQFQIIVDVFQSILVDSRFKSDTELSLLYHLSDLQKVCFVSATPMMDDFLSQLDEFKNLPYYEFDWETEDPSRIIKPILSVKVCKSISVEAEAGRIIQKYLEGKFAIHPYIDSTGNKQKIESREAILYVNSVNSIAKIIKKNGLTYDNTNVLCAKTEKNEKKIMKAFGIGKRELKNKYGVASCLGNIPKLGEPHKMFTLCTRTVYLGADFYSTCGRTFIFSDANIDSLAIDISMDLEQIMGRQRLEINPWKNCAELYVKTNFREVSKDYFSNYVSKKIKKTENLIKGYDNNNDPEIKYDMAETYERDTLNNNYKYNYLSVNRYTGKIKTPVLNNLILLSEIRAFQVQQEDYRDRFSVFSTLENYGFEIEGKEFTEYLNTFNSMTVFSEKLKYICEDVQFIDDKAKMRFIEKLPPEFSSWYKTLGPKRLKTFGYQKSKLEEELNSTISNQSIEDILALEVKSKFNVEENYSKEYIKSILKDIYEKVGYNKAAKASDIERWFDIKDQKVPNKVTGKRDHGYKILGKK